MKLTKKDEEIQNVVRNCSNKHKGFKYDPSQGIGGIQKWCKDNKQMDPVANHKFSDTQLRQAMTQEEYGNPAYSHLTYDRICKVCNKKLSYEERMGKICKECEAKKAAAKKAEERKAALSALVYSKSRPSTPMHASTVEAVASEPVKSTVTFMSPEEQEKNMCRVSTIADLMQHAPDRAIVMIHIENYNVYQTKENK